MMRNSETAGCPTALVTGASRGIGRSIAKMLFREGYSLLISGRTRLDLEETAELCRKDARRDFASGRVEILPLDLADTGAPAQLVGRTAELFGRLDLLVNNAGMVKSGPIESYTSADWEELMNLNARAPFFLMQASLSLLDEANPGIIVNIGSAVSKKGYADQALYSASKHALLGMTKSAARELLPRGIRVHAVLPGGVDTEMAASVRPDIDRSQLIDPDEIAATVRYLISLKGNAAVDEIAVRRASKTPWD